MPRGFLSRRGREEWGAFPAVIEDHDLISYFLLTPADLRLITSLRGEANKLGVALQVCSLRYLGFFVSDLSTIPENALHNLAEQIDCVSDALSDYSQRRQTRHDHQRRIMSHLGFSRAAPEDLDVLLTWLIQRTLENERPSLLLQQAVERLYKQRLVRPGITTLEELVVRARLQAHDWTFDLLGGMLDESRERHLDSLLRPAEGHRYSMLSWLRRPVSGSSANDILTQLEKLAFIETWDLDDWPFQELPPARLDYLANLARRSSISAIEHKASQERYPILMAFLYEARADLTDSILDMFNSCVAEVYRKANTDLRNYLLQITKHQQQRVLYFNLMARTLLDPNIEDMQVRTSIFARISPEQLEELLNEDIPSRTELDFFNTRYSYFRQFFPTLLDQLVFHALNLPDPLMAAIEVLREVNTLSNRPKYLEGVSLGFVPSDWEDYVVDSQGRVSRRWYELCVLSELRIALRSGRIWVEHSRFYAPLDSYLIPQDQWPRLKPVFLEMVNIPEDSEAHLAQRIQQMEDAYWTFDDEFVQNEAVRIEQGKVVLTPYQGEDSESPVAQQLQDLLPHLQLAELLHEVDQWTGFSERFIHAAHQSSRIENLNEHLYAILLAQARNIDFQQMVDVVELPYRRLRWCNNWYVREEALQPATADLVNQLYRQPLSHYWGDGRFSSSDGQRFEVSVRSRHASPLPRFFGYGRGLTFLTWTSNQYSQYGTLVTPTSEREATYSLDRILDNDTDLDIREHTTDTEGYTDLMFALFDLLGMQFAPRLKSINKATFYCVDTTIPYRHIRSLNRRRLRLDLIRRHWDDMLRLAASLKMRWVTASLIVRKLQSYPIQHVLTTALQEYGRLVKTTFLLQYLTSEAYRRRIGAQLNKGEKIHALRAHLFTGHQGRIAKKDSEQHLNQANCLNLITNAILLWNTVYMQAGIDYLREQGQEISDEELEHLSPVRYQHINIHGRYFFDISVPLNANGLRPLNTA